MLLSVLLFNAETWGRLTKENIKKLESVDLMLLRKLLQTPISSPKASLYLETGCIPIRFLIKGKRIMYLHHILTRNEDALIRKVFSAQVQKPTKGDWCQVVREDLDSIGLATLSFKDIALKSKENLRNVVMEKIRYTAFQELEEEKKNLSKVAGISYSKLEMQPYLYEPKLTTKLKQLTYKWRTRMIKVGWNYGEKGMCPICLDENDTQSHLLECKELNNINNLAELADDSEQYDLTKHMKQLEAAIRKREVILEEREKERDGDS